MQPRCLLQYVIEGKKLKIEMFLVEKWLNKHVVAVLWYATCL